MSLSLRNRSPREIDARENNENRGAHGKRLNHHSDLLSFHICSCEIIDSIAESFCLGSFDDQSERHLTRFARLRAVLQPSRNDDALTGSQNEIALFGLKVNFTTEHNEAFVFVLVRMPSLEFALKLDQADDEIINIGQVNWREGTCDLVFRLANRKELDLHNASLFEFDHQSVTFPGNRDRNRPVDHTGKESIFHFQVAIRHFSLKKSGLEYSMRNAISDRCDTTPVSADLIPLLH